MFTLVREEVSIQDAIANQQSWPIRITATLVDPEGDPASIFVYHTAAAPLADRDFFSCVASAPQMTELPAGSGDTGVPFYRTAELLVICRSADHATEFWTKIVAAVKDLADNLAQVDVLSVAETITITPNA